MAPTALCLQCDSWSVPMFVHMPYSCPYYSTQRLRFADVKRRLQIHTFTRHAVPEVHSSPLRFLFGSGGPVWSRGVRCGPVSSNVVISHTDCVCCIDDDLMCTVQIISSIDLSFPTGLIPWVFILLNGWICLHGVLD